MNKKNQFINYVDKTFYGKAKDLILEEIELFYKKEKIDINKYKKGEDVFLKKGTFLHGISDIGKFDFIVKNGFISHSFYEKTGGKIFNSVGMWNIREDTFLRDYIKFYSGATIYYYKKKENNKIKEYLVSSFGNIEEDLIKINNDLDVWMWNSEQTKEIRFMPSLSSNKVQLAFILNMESDYAKKIKEYDFFNKKYDDEILKYFCLPEFLNDLKINGINVLTTNRESSIFFGVPNCLIEGILVGRKYENDLKMLEYIKKKLPNCYICNLDGKVIIPNKKNY